MSWTPLRLPQGVLRARETLGEGAEPVVLADGALSLRFRHGWPLVFVGEQLALVPGQAVAAEFRVAGDGAGMSFDWRPQTFSTGD